jgi:hypothetical protein
MPSLTDRRPVSLRRVSLLLAIGLLASVALTRPGRWMLARALRPDAVLPAWQLDVLQDGCVRVAWLATLQRSFPDMLVDADHPPDTRPSPAPELVAQRLGRLGGWTTAVLFELGATPDDLVAAGLTDRQSSLGVVRRSGDVPPADSRLRSGPERHWILALLDPEGREVSRAMLGDLRPGFVRAGDECGAPIYRRDPAAGTERNPPVVSVFRRSAGGEVVSG